MLVGLMGVTLIALAVDAFRKEYRYNFGSAVTNAFLTLFLGGLLGFFAICIIVIVGTELLNTQYVQETEVYEIDNVTFSANTEQVVRTAHSTDGNVLFIPTSEDVEKVHYYRKDTGQLESHRVEDVDIFIHEEPESKIHKNNYGLQKDSLWRFVVPKGFFEGTRYEILISNVEPGGE